MTPSTNDSKFQFHQSCMTPSTIDSISCWLPVQLILSFSSINLVWQYNQVSVPSIFHQSCMTPSTIVFQVSVPSILYDSQYNSSSINLVWLPVQMILSFSSINLVWLSVQLILSFSSINLVWLSVQLILSFRLPDNWFKVFSQVKVLYDWLPKFSLSQGLVRLVTQFSVMPKSYYH